MNVVTCRVIVEDAQMHPVFVHLELNMHPSMYPGGIIRLLSTLDLLIELDNVNARRDMCAWME